MGVSVIMPDRSVLPIHVFIPVQAGNHRSGLVLLITIRCPLALEAIHDIIERLNVERISVQNVIVWACDKY